MPSPFPMPQRRPLYEKRVFTPERMAALLKTTGQPLPRSFWKSVERAIVQLRADMYLARHERPSRYAEAAENTTKALCAARQRLETSPHLNFLRGELAFSKDMLASMHAQRTVIDVVGPERDVLADTLAGMAQIEVILQRAAERDRNGPKPVMLRRRATVVFAANVLRAAGLPARTNYVASYIKQSGPAGLQVELVLAVCNVVARTTDLIDMQTPESVRELIREGVKPRHCAA